MQKIFFKILLFVLPLIFTVINLLYKNSIGEYYLNVSAYFVPNYDPSYVYLLSSLNLAQFSGYGTGFFQHPGIPTQLLGAIIIKLFHTLQSVDPDIVQDVILNSEFYLNRINFAAILLNASALYILGLISYRKFRNIYSALFIQLTPFGFSIIYYKFALVTTEPILVFTTLLFIAAVLRFLNEKDLSDKKQFKNLIVFGLLCGFGIACKVLFLPLLIIPLVLLKRFLYKIIFLLISFLSFAIIFICAVNIDNADDFLSWISDLIIHSGKYGTGQKYFINVNNLYSYVDEIFLDNPLFGFAYILILSILILGFFKSYKTSVQSNRYYALLSGIFCAMSIQSLIVLKHFDYHYMIPVYLLSIPGIYISYIILADILPKYTKNSGVKYSVVIIFLIIFLYNNFRIVKNDLNLINFKNIESRQIIENLKYYDGNIVASTYAATGKPFSLFLASGYGGTQKSKYFSILSDIYPNDIFYIRWTNKFFDRENYSNLKARLIKAKRFYFVCDSKYVFDEAFESLRKYLDNPGIKYNVMFQNKIGEGIYEIVLE